MENSIWLILTLFYFLIFRFKFNILRFIPILAAKLESHPEIRQSYFEFLCRIFEEEGSRKDRIEVKYLGVVEDTILQGISDNNPSIKTSAMK
jgi:hypothetical protein